MNRQITSIESAMKIKTRIVKEYIDESDYIALLLIDDNTNKIVWSERIPVDYEPKYRLIDTLNK